ncbi:Hypothetical protein ADU72_1532 [Pediococcus damnosus]|uniref:Focal AT domain-containing protein n=1 Tax=Pediococcus damnosus TaxID=51663 RepID=A0A0R2HA81_9LACO|nr:hypothetical protein [Pediococcus damnosus]AMV60137.1 Hypothetical protein ADU69_0461 [Pediococcus damnosus]AMV62659.1 Hypothetical protein ADU70_1167 [Pediococcus damnosus]AMV64382.1 Hypothetical protein ADU71_0461 [Pediococcus damnosus]AMV67459.1 Hypothetical protein ADU72_1532 [Pediococcus damnosus]AMV69186.1 Hypothetical protein ADU73_0780 [Pediococcus damnosus]
MRKVNPQGYVNLIGNVMDKTDEMGKQVDPHFQNLKKTQALKGIDSLGERDLHEIVSNFKEAVDLYQKNVQTLKNAKPPVQVLGRHKQFVSAYQTYAADCEKMLESIDEKNRSLDSTMFAQAEQAQDKDMEAVSKGFDRIMHMMVG